MRRSLNIPDELYPFESHWIELGGVPIHYLDEGDGPVLLLVHGNFMWSFSYRKLVAEISKSHRCIAIDLAGMGLSGNRSPLLDLEIMARTLPAVVTKRGAI